MRIGRREALELWRRAVSRIVRFDGPDITLRQMAILSRVHLTPGPHTVRGLAENLKVTKAVVVRALDTLSQLGFVERRPDPRDKRSVLVVPAARGAAYLSHVGDIVAFAAEDSGQREQGAARDADTRRVA